MARKRDPREKVAKELRGLVVSLVFIAAALLFGFFVLPDMLTNLFMDPMDLPTAP